MKNKVTLLAGIALFVAASLPAQSIKDNDLTYSYVRLPMEPLKGFTNYQSKVELSYAAENAAMKAEYEKKLADAEIQYQKDVAEYNKKSTAQKLADQKLLNEGKPQKQTPPQPYKNLPREPYKNIPSQPNYKKQYDTNLLASSYLKLEGFTNAPENAVIITVTVSEFDIQGPKMVTEVKQMTRVANGQSTPYNQTYYHYETSYKQPMSVKVEVPGKGVVFNQTIEQFNTYTVVKTNATDNLAAQGMTSTTAYANNLEEKALAENLKYINELVNSKYGFSKVPRTTVLNNVESKKMNYDDYQLAYENALSGYNMLATDRAGADVKLKTAIGIWEKAMLESNPGDKKARIDADVTMATRFNLLEAYIMTGDYANAETQIMKMNAADPSKKEKKRIEELDVLVKDLKARAAINK